MKYLDRMTRRLCPARFHLTAGFIVIIFGACLLLSLSRSGESVGLAEYTVYLTARPDVITADAGSSTTINAEVRDSDGKLAPNGTIVDFSASLGRIDQRATTSSGVARVRMQSTLATGVSMITAAVQGSRGVAEVKVEILAAGTKTESLTGVTISTKNGQLLFDPARRIADCVGGVTIKMGTLEISSFYAVMDISRRTMRLRSGSEGNSVIIKRGNVVIRASEALLDIGKMTGLLFNTGDEGARRQLISLRDLKQREESDVRSVQAPVPPVSGVFLIGAKKIIVKPGKEIKLINATFFLEGDSTVTIPFYRIPFSGSGGGKTFTYGSEGLRADIPIYLGLDENSSTAIRIRRQEQSGWGYYGGSKRWETDFVRDYDLDTGSSGQVAIRRFGSSDWGLRWTGRTDYGQGLESYIYLDSPSHSDVYGNFDLSQSKEKYTTTFSFRGTKQSEGRSTHYTGISYQMRPVPISGPTFTMSMSGRGFYDSSASAVARHMGGAANVQLYAGPYKTFTGFDLSAQTSVGNVWGGSNPGRSAFGNLGLYRDLGRSATFGMNYNYSWDDAAGGGTYDTVSADIYLVPVYGLSTHFSVIKGLRGGTTSSFGNLSYRISKNWEFRALSTWQNYSGYSYNDAQLGLVRTLGSQEARLFYSKSRSRLLFEFSAAGL